MKTKVKALDSFVHGRVHLVAGEEAEFSKGEADELVKAGLAAKVDEQDEAAQPSEAPAATTATDDDVNDLLGGEKMDADVQNKMEPAPDNKGVKKSTSKKAD